MNLRYPSFFLILFFCCCSPKIRTSITSKHAPLSVNDFVLVLQKEDKFDNKGIEIGTIKSGDNGFSGNCTYNEVIDKLIQLSRENGANLIKIVERKSPDQWSSCERLTCKIYNIPDIRIYEKEIEWSYNRKLSWDDFKGNSKPLSNINAAAETYCGFGFETNRVTMFKATKIFISNKFYCNLSWVRPDQKDRLDLLEHEQVHFDLCEVYARQLRKNMKDKKLTVFNLNKDAAILFREQYALYLDRQELYEKETNYGLNRQQQVEWTKKIDEEIKDLNLYK